jgi:predicted secreted Zn-dependent protease
MAVTAKKGKVGSETYKIGGDTLSALVDEMKKKGPVDPNESKRYSGKCFGKLSIDLPKGSSVTLKTLSEGPAFELEATLNGTVSVDCTITLPALASDKKLSPAAKKEWTRFLAAVDKHENGHVEAYLDIAKDVAKKLGELKVTGKGPDKKSAATAAIQDIQAKVIALYGGTQLDDLMKASAKAYDAQNKHGESQGAALDGKIA